MNQFEREAISRVLDAREKNTAEKKLENKKLRDDFAGKAMQATDLEKYADMFGLEWADRVAEDSYKLADAMLNQREKQTPL